MSFRLGVLLLLILAVVSCAGGSTGFSPAPLLGEQVLELTIEPDTGLYHLLASGEGTPTPIPTTFHFY